MTFHLDHTLPDTVPISHLSAQLATLGAFDPQVGQQLWAVVLTRLSPNDRIALVGALPPQGEIANHIRRNLLEL